MNKLYDATIGFIIGDAFGVPYEFIPRENINVKDDMIGFGTHNQPAGTWSDDTSMLLATIDAIDENGLDKNKVSTNFLNWLYANNYTKYGHVFDAGRRTISALKYYSTYHEFLDGGIYSNGNGSLMRILPLAFLNCSDELINDISAITHPHEISKACCRIYVKFIRAMIAGEPNLREKLVELNDIENQVLDLDAIFHIDHTAIKSSAYVIDTLEAVFWSFFHTKSYKEAIIEAVRLGNDTDTIAALTGALAALLYGSETIPEKWYFTTINKQVTKIINKKVKFIQL